MITNKLNFPINFVDSAETLAQALPYWFDANILAVDAEFSLTGFHHCVLALLQVATHDQAWIIDPLAISQLIQPTLRVMAELPWIAHDFSGDGIVFKRIYNIVPSSIMDTMLLARSLGYSQPGLKNMAKMKLGIDVSKDEQHSNWIQRPLRKTQIDYAAHDAYILLPLLRSLAGEVEAKRLEPIANQRLSRLPHYIQRLLEKVNNYQVPASNHVLDKIRSMGLGEEAVEIAKKLTVLRCQWGNQGDIAAVMELGNRWIVARIKYPPKNKEELKFCMSNQRFMYNRLEEIWEALGSGYKTM